MWRVGHVARNLAEASNNCLCNSMAHRLVRNFKLMRIQSLCRKGKYDRARSITCELLSEYPFSIGYNMLLADVGLFSGDLCSAKQQYTVTKEMLEKNPPKSKDDEAYYSAYLDFRVLAIECHTLGSTLPPWDDFAALLNELDANRMIKRLFQLP